MKSFALVALFVAGVSSSALNGYGADLRVDSYGSSYGSAALVRDIPIVSMNHEIRGSLADSLTYETANGIRVADDTVAVRGPGGLYDDGYGNLVQSDVLVKKTGSYSFISPEGLTVNTNWVADENGFRVEGAHLPQPVPLPAEHAEAHRLVLSRSGAPGWRLETAGGYDAPVAVRSTYEVPSIRVASYEAPVAVRSSAYEVPAVRVESYEAPVRSLYEAPVPAIRIEQTYEAPVIRESSYDAPAIRVASYETPVIPAVRVTESSSYDKPAPPAPIVFRSLLEDLPAPVTRIESVSYGAPLPAIRAAAY